MYLSPKEELDHIDEQLTLYALTLGREICTPQFTPEMARKKFAVAILTGDEDVEDWKKVYQLVTRRQELLFGG